MSIKKYFFIFLLFCLVFSGCFTEKELKKTEVNLSYFGDKARYEELYQNSAKIDPLHEKVYGGILPHHLIVGEEFANYFTLLKNQNPRIVVVIGPNHNDIGTDLQTTKTPYLTSYGLLETDEDLVNKLTRTNLVEVNDLPFQTEHSISAEVSFLKKTFPKTKLLPIILSSRTSEADVDRLGILLSKILPENSLVLASVDFSHYQPEVVADFHDQTSLATILNFDFQNIFNLEVDSPASLYALMSYLKQKKAQKNLSQVHTNSASYTNQPETEETTSHFFLTFGKGQNEENSDLSFLFFGDSMFDRGIKELHKRDENLNLFTQLEGVENRFFTGNHFNLLNLEGPIAELENFREKLVVLNHDKILTLKYLKAGSFNLVNLENNHIEDYFEIGAEETAQFLEENNIDYLGINKVCNQQIRNDLKVAFCAFNDISNNLNFEDSTQIVSNQKESNDKVVVSMHWGNEDSPDANERQKELAHLLIENGADVIIGHHPHVIQPFEIYQNKPIIYSLGNLIFDQPEKEYGLGVGVFLKKQQTILYFYPIKFEQFLPRLLNYPERKDFYDWYLKAFEGYRTELNGRIILDD